ncbi:MAG: acyltransferase [Kiritimatiellae bacterium]|nr:acyltransferase [Kiritimatiellia bacterium]
MAGSQACSVKRDTFIPWVGWMRVVALFLVCACHACDPLSAFGRSEDKTWIEFYGALIRVCVPLFVMMTGVLLLPTADSFGGMFHKRIKRVLLPFLFWNAVYAALPWLLHLCGVSQTSIQRVFFPFAAPVHTDAMSIVRTFFLSLIQFNQYAVQLWYIYLLVGLYLFMPILSAWLREATLRAKWIFVAIWGVTLLAWYWPLALYGAMQTAWGQAFFADYVVRFLGSPTFVLAHATSFDAFPILGVCDWNTYGGLHMFSGFIGYLVLGHVLKTATLSFKRTLCIALPLLVTGYLVVYYGTHWIWNTPDFTWKMAEYFWWYCSLPVAMMSAAVFYCLNKFVRHPYGRLRLCNPLGDMGSASFVCITCLLPELIFSFRQKSLQQSWCLFRHFRAY